MVADELTRQHPVTTVRLSRGISQGALASMANTSQQTISRIEAGTQNPSDRLRVAIARALGCKAVELFPYEDED